MEYSAMKKAYALLVTCLLGVASMAHAQVYRVADIVVEGNRRVEQSAILPLLTAKPGQVVSIETIDADIKAIYQLGRFEDVSALVTERNGVNTLVYQVEERPLVRKVEFTGNKEFDEKKLLALITLKVPDIYEPRIIDESIRAIKDAYVKEGYHAIEVQASREDNESYETSVTFKIEEGAKALVKSITFTGNKVLTDRQLKKVMGTKERWIFSWITGRGAFLEEMLKNDLELIADAYYNIGYLQVKIKEPVVMLSDDKRNLTINIQIEEGEQFKVGKIDISGDLLKPKTELLDMVSFKGGDIFSRSRLRSNVLVLNDFYGDQGYAYVNVSPLTRLNPEPRTVDLTFDIEKGPKVHIDRINISGNTRTRDKVVRREMEFVEGDLFNSSGMKESRRLINNLGFFESVDLVTRKTKDESKMDIDISVKERPTGNFTVGAGYSSVDGVVFQGSISQENFLGLALGLNLSGSFGGKSTTYNIGLTDPHFLDSKYTVGFDLYKTEREYTEYDKASTGGDFKLGFPLAEKNRAFFIYRYEQKTISNVDPNATLLISSQEGESTLSSISATLSRETTDYRIDPTRGYLSSLTGEFAGLGGTQYFSKVTLDHRHYLKAFGSTYFALHGHIGQVFKIGDNEIPIDERFLLGGINTLRGFESRKVGPRLQRSTQAVDPVTGTALGTTDTFDYIGGDKEAFVNLEYIFPIYKDLGLKGLVFFDAGNAWGEDEDFFTDIRYSVGAGIRWFSPMGPLRLEWGFNLDPTDDEQGSQIEFSIGRFY
jgi:outer membrane protein insertion porin family